MSAPVHQVGGAGLRVGLVGLGAMGGAMGANLARAGFAPVGHDLAPASVERFEQAGGRAAASAGAVADEADVVVLSLPSAGAFEAVASGPDGLAAGALDGVVVIETSTLPIPVKERGREALAARGATLLDCPLSGTGHQAVTGDLVVMASGDRAAVERCTPVFEAFSRSHYYVGEFGNGSKMKFVANHLVAIHNVAAAEALTLARASGLELEQVLQVVGDGAGGSRMLEVRGPKMIAHDYASGVRGRVFDKDLAVIADFARSLDVPVPLLAASTQLYAAAFAMGHDEDDTAAVYEVYGRLRPDADA